jgi:hypothetical protein
MAGILPLLTRQMFNKMSFAGASSFLGGVVSFEVMTVPEFQLMPLGFSIDYYTLGSCVFWTTDQGPKSTCARK